MGVTQAGERLGFALESRFEVRPIGHVRRENLDGNGPVEPLIPRAIDLTHAARADRRDDLIGAQSCSCCYRQGLWCEFLNGERPDYTQAWNIESGRSRCGLP